MYTIGRVLIFPSLRYWPRIYTESIGIYNDKLGQNGFDIRDLYYFHRYACLIDWLIDYCLTASKQYFSYILDENKYINIY